MLFLLRVISGASRRASSLGLQFGWVFNSAALRVNALSQNGEGLFLIRLGHKYAHFAQSIDGEPVHDAGALVADGNGNAVLLESCADDLGLTVPGLAQDDKRRPVSHRTLRLF